MNQSTFFVRFSGVFSAIVFLYAATIHGLLLIDRGLLSHLMTPTMGVMHGFICIGGAILGVYFIGHAFKNRSLTRRSRLLWGLALICGYGLIFYWYKHIRGRATLK